METKSSTETRERLRKVRCKNGTRSQKVMSFRLDNDLGEYLNTKPNKGRYINDLIRRERDINEIMNRQAP